MINKTIAITGHTGVLGNNFIKENKKNKFIKCNIDITNKKKVFKWIKNKKFGLFLHFAAIVPVTQVKKNKKKAKKVNFLGTKNIVDALIKYKKYDNIWFFYSSTSHVYKPKKRKVKIKENESLKSINYYGYTKALAEKYIIYNFSKHNIKYCIGRIFSFTHPKQKKEFFIPSLFYKFSKKNNSTIIFNKVNTLRDFISTKDIFNSIKILFKLRKTGIYNISSGIPINLIKIIYKVSRLFKNNKKIKISDDSTNNNLIANISKLKKLNFKPKYSIDYILNNYYNSKYKKN